MTNYIANHLINKRINFYLDLPMKIHKKKFEKSINQILTVSGYHESRFDEQADSISEEYFLYHYQIPDPKITLDGEHIHNHVSREEWLRIKNTIYKQEWLRIKKANHH